MLSGYATYQLIARDAAPGSKVPAFPMEVKVLYSAEVGEALAMTRLTVDCVDLYIGKGHVAELTWSEVPEHLKDFIREEERNITDWKDLGLTVEEVREELAVAADWNALVREHAPGKI